MSKRPKSVTDIRMADVARSLGAPATAEAIEKNQGLDAVVRAAIIEMHPRDFIDLLERARDRQAAAHTLILLRDYGQEEFGLRARLAMYRETFEDFRWIVADLFKYRDWANTKEEFATYRVDMRGFRKEIELAKALVPYRDYMRWCVMFVGEGPDSNLMRDVLWHQRAHMTYELGEWLRNKLTLLERTPDELAAARAKKREQNRIYWDPNYNPSK